MLEPMVLQKIKNSLFDAFKRDNVIRYFIKRATRTQEVETLAIESGNNAGEAIVYIYSDSRDVKFNRAIDAEDATFESVAYDVYTKRTIICWSDMIDYILKNKVMNWNNVGYVMADEF